jgi:hypothetical protein
MKPKVKYPHGISSFTNIVKEGYVLIDKTPFLFLKDSPFFRFFQTQKYKPNPKNPYLGKKINYEKNHIPYFTLMAWQ